MAQPPADRPPFVYLNGAIVPRDQAKLDIEDRAALFGDGVYEVLAYFNRKPVAMGMHLDRLRRSLEAVRIDASGEVEKLPEVSLQLLEENNLSNARIYWQISRGSDGARAYMPAEGTRPTVMAIAYPGVALEETHQMRSQRAILLEDQRWHHCDIKSLMLLPSVLSTLRTRDRGAQLAILHREGRITEAVSANLFFVKDGALRTHRADQWILPGVTRSLLIELAKQAGVPVIEEAVRTDELGAIDEAFLCGTTSHVTPIASIEGQPIADGQPGPITRRMQQLLLEETRRQCG